MKKKPVKRPRAPTNNNCNDYEQMKLTITV